MATVHPSRLNLIPESLLNEQDLPPDTARRHTTEYDREKSGHSYSERRRSRSRERDRYSRRGEDRSVNRDSGRDDYDSRRRASPKYEDYRRPEPAASGSAPDGAGSMYPNRGNHSGYGQNTDWLESRRVQRENIQLDIWPPSPPAPYKELLSKHKSSRKSKRARSPSTDSSSEEEERRRKERKERKRAKRTKERERDRGRHDRKHRHRSHSRHRSRFSDEESEDERHDKRKHKSRSKSKTSDRRSRSHKSRSRSERRSKSKSLRLESRSPSRSPSPSNSDEGEWVIKESSVAPPAPLPSVGNAPTARDTSPSASKKKGNSRATSQAVDESDSESDEEVGPKPLFKATTNKKIDERAYGGALLRGEGSAMAAFLQDGTHVRIPRRGEIGLTSDQIEQFETVGYVMSGSRHKRMNAVRMRKENQVISAEEKRGILKLQKEERERREAILREEFGELVHEKLKANPNQVAGPSKG